MWFKSSFSIPAVAATSFCLIGGTSTARAHADLGDQLFKLLPLDGAALDFFGFSAAISGATAIVGSWEDAAPPGLISLDVIGNLWEVSETDASLTLIGNTGLVGTGSLEYNSADGFLYSMTIRDRAAFYRIDPTDATTMFIGSAGEFIFEGGLQFAPDGTLYATNGAAAAAPELLTVDLGTGMTSLVGVMSDGDHDVNGLAWRTSDDMLIGLDRETNSLLTIDPDTAMTSILAAVPETVGDVGGMAGFGSSGFYNVQNGNLYSFDMSNGAPALIGNMGVESRGLAIIPNAPTCPWDLDLNGVVGASDLLSLLAQWGTDPGGPPDFDGDGFVGASDLLALLANWGPCP